MNSEMKIHPTVEWTNDFPMCVMWIFLFIFFEKIKADISSAIIVVKAAATNPYLGMRIAFNTMFVSELIIAAIIPML